MADNRNNTTIPFVAFESALDRLERANKRYALIVIILITAIAITNGIWLWAWMQYDYVSESTEVESGDGVANYVGNDGDITNYGTDTASKNIPNKE